MQKRFQRFFVSLKEHGWVSYAKVATAGGFCDVDCIIAKATSPDDVPVPERYVNELARIFSVSPTSFRAFSLSLTRRFSKTRSWRVALKCLFLVHRLLRSLQENTLNPFIAELLWARSNSLLSLHPCRFRDSSSSLCEDYTNFVHSYARVIDEALDNDMTISINGNNNSPEEANSENDWNKMIELLSRIQVLIDRITECRPAAGAAARSFLVASTMKYLIRDSFMCYATFRDEIVVILDNLFQMPYRSCIASFGIYKKAALQTAQLAEFYEWCKETGFLVVHGCYGYECPLVEKIPDMQIQALESFLNGMWHHQSTTTADHRSNSSSSSSLSSSSSTSPNSSLMVQPMMFSITEDEANDWRLVQWRNDAVVTTARWEKFEEEKEPLIKPEDGDDQDDESWEKLLDASICQSPACSYYKEEEDQRKENNNDPRYQMIESPNPFQHLRCQTTVVVAHNM